MLLLAVSTGIGMAKDQGPGSGISFNEPNKAVNLLIKRAYQDMRVGKLEDADVKAVRAIRIDPTSPAVWHALAQIRLLDKQFSQADVMAKKSLTLESGGTSKLKSMNIALMNTAKRGAQLTSAASIAAALEENLAEENERQERLLAEEQEVQGALAQAERDYQEASYYQEEMEAMKEAELILDEGFDIERDAYLSESPEASQAEVESTVFADASEFTRSDTRSARSASAIPPEVELTAFETASTPVRTVYKVRRPHRRF